jgi:ATP-binding cassette subfamily B protein
MMAAFTLLSNIIPAINRFVDANILLQETSIASTRLMDMILVGKEDCNGNLPFDMKQNLSIQNGAFSWNGRRNLFENVNLTIEKGKLTALWGNSGAGKSTIVQILQRKYRLNIGAVLCDETDIEEFDLSDYRKNLAVVPQSIKIFNGTIAENIIVGREISDIVFLQNRLLELGLHTFFKRFEFGLFTVIGEDGRELSGGEKQIVSITRALLFNPKVLIIDEGLSGIDIELEKMIFDVIKKHAEKNAVLLITHNLNSIIKTDYVYVLAEGTILQKGTPQELITNNGYFYKMWDMKKSMYKNNLVDVNE